MKVPPMAAWTVLIYTSASRDLEVAVSDSLQEICDGPGPPQDIQVVAQMGWRGQAQRFQLHQSAHPQSLGDPESLDMTEPQQLQRFLKWGMKAYPAQRYAVVLGGHGAGFGGAVTDSDRRKMLRLPQLEEALGGLPARPEMVIFNTCLMAQAEVAEQLASVTSHLVASQTQLTGLGLPLAAWLQHLPDCQQGDSAASALVDEASQAGPRSPQVGAIDLDQWPQLSLKLDALAQQILDHPQSSSQLLQHIKNQAHLWPRPQDRPLVDQLDLVSLCRSWQQEEQLPDRLRQQSGEVADLVQQICQHSQPQAHGLSVYAPDQPFAHLGPPQARLGQLYGELRWARQTRWDEAITALISQET